ncbi:hypothetical protein CUMW_243960 [Citrus unshiu]|uniref:very-long-chain 3-oxoacyl-CoA synthase n=1 Tax=Citrus unshiu TaxID=55188 RepID=A0A2H5QMH1_CITUN|nr:hypothetical protein CUMW_243960 [Citrus unshiu]
MAAGCTLSIILHLPHLRYTLCFSPTISPSGPLFFYDYIFYLSKIHEFLDTVLIILSNSIQRLTFLPVYHHAIVIIMCCLWLQTKQSLFPIALVTNASVHVIMYGYYLLCVMGLLPNFVVLVLMLYYNFTGFGCSGILGRCFNAVFNASLLTLFVNFHSEDYAKKKQG